LSGVVIHTTGGVPSVKAGHGGAVGSPYGADQRMFSLTCYNRPIKTAILLQGLLGAHFKT